jgi:hypothetical protein
MKVLLGIVLFALVGAAVASEYRRQEGGQQKQIGIQIQKAKAQQSLTVNGDEESEAAAIAPNPYAHAPSAQCRYGWSVTGAGVGFGAGISASEWDKICGLWMAAQQTTGEAQQEAAAAAFCLTMKDAGVQSAVCVDWNNGQNLMMSKKVELNDNRATIVFGGAGDGGRN